MKILRRIVDGFNKIPPFVLVFVLICTYFLNFNVSTNGEQYYLYAKQFINPDWIPGSVTLKDTIGTRVIFQYLAGWILQYVSFYQFAFWGSLFTFIFYALAISKILTALKISNVVSLFFSPPFILIIRQFMLLVG